MGGVRADDDAVHHVTAQHVHVFDLAVFRVGGGSGGICPRQHAGAFHLHDRDAAPEPDCVHRRAEHRLRAGFVAVLPRAGHE